MNPTQAAQALRARVEDLTRPEDEKDLLHYAAMCVEAYEIWQQKTDWVQDQVSTFPINPLGKHRADVLREEIERLRSATFGDAIKLHGTSTDPYALAARDMAQEGELEIDLPTIVSRGADEGAYVMAWLWVGNDKLAEEDLK